MEVKIMTFDGHPVTFQIERNEKMMVNATEMAKVFGKRVNDFMSMETTLEFVKEALKNGDSRNLKVFSQSDLYVSVQNTGTWMHRVLALKFAAWLSPAFELWVYSTIEQLLFGHYAEREESLRKTIRLKEEAERLRVKTDNSGDDFERYLQVERELEVEKAVRKKLTAKVVEGLKIPFEFD